MSDWKEISLHDIKGIKIGQIVLKKDKMTYYLKLSLSSCSSFFNGKDLYNIL